MARNKKRHKPPKIPAKMPINEVEVASSLSDDSPGTSFSSTRNDEDASMTWGGNDRTNAPQVGDYSEHSESYAKTYPELLEKYLLSKQSIFYLLALVTVGFIFITDNKVNKLDNWSGIWWTITKCGMIIGSFLGIGVIQVIIKKMRK